MISLGHSAIPGSSILKSEKSPQACVGSRRLPIDFTTHQFLVEYLNSPMKFWYWLAVETNPLTLTLNWSAETTNYVLVYSSTFRKGIQKGVSELQATHCSEPIQVEPWLYLRRKTPDRYYVSTNTYTTFWDAAMSYIWALISCLVILV